MILVDTSVWIDHLRSSNRRLRALLEADQVVTHPLVIGELACGSIRNRTELLALLKTLPSATIAQHDEVLQFVDGQKLYGRGIGWIDAHLLASARLDHLAIWTLDKPLSKIAESIGIS
jgi:predicted nucleic acid-binding protein